jgi:regulator of replication initiation timing
MSRGKYAERARNKRDADLRYANAVAEGNRLQSKLREIRHLHAENSALREELAHLRAELADGSGARIRELEQLVVTAADKLQHERDQTEEQYRKIFEEVLEIVNRSGFVPSSPEWFDLLGPLGAVITNMVDHGRLDKLPPHVKTLVAKRQIYGQLYVRRGRRRGRSR